MDNNNTGKKNIADTMEINSILLEAKQHRLNSEKTVYVSQQNSTVNNDVSRQDPKTVYYNRPQSNIPQNNRPQTTRPQSGRPQNNAPQNRPATQNYNHNFQENFVIYDDEVKNNKKNNTPKKNNSKTSVVIITVVCALLVVLVIAGFCIFKMQSDSFKYADNLYINGINISGMTEDEAREELKLIETKLANSIRINVNAGTESVTLTKNDFNYTFTTEDVLGQAKRYTEQTKDTTKQQNFAISIKLDDKSCADAAKRVSEKANTEPVNAYATKFDSTKKGSDRFTFVDSKNGVMVKETELVTQLHSFVNEGKVSGNIDAEVEEVEPKYTTEYLKKNIKKVSEFTTVSTNDANGNTNMRISLKACNNSIINPGEVWSFNECTGDSNQTSLGYKPAGVINNGRSEIGIGGGICQSSTTIFNAALLCGMDIVERDCHYKPSAYVPVGRDATIDYGNIDLKMKNVFDYQLFMECFMKGSTLYCRIYGVPAADFDEVKLESSITSRSSGSYRATTIRTFYLDGELVRTDEPFYSTYYTGSGSGSSSSSSDDDRDSEPEDPTEGGSDEPSDDPSDEPSSETPSGDPGTEPSTPGPDSGGEGGSSGEIEPPIVESPPAETPAVEGASE